MKSREGRDKLIGGGAALIAAAFLTIFAATEAALGPAQDLSNGGAGDPGRIALSISLLVAAFAAIAVCLLMLRTMLRRTGDALWPSAALVLAAVLFLLSVALLLVGQLTDWWPGELLGVVNLPGLVLLVVGWFIVGRSTLTTAGATRLGILVVTQAALVAVLFAVSAVGGPIVLLVEAAFIAGWILVAAWIGSASAALGSAAPTT